VSVVLCCSCIYSASREDHFARSSTSASHTANTPPSGRSARLHGTADATWQIRLIDLAGACVQQLVGRADVHPASRRHGDRRHGDRLLPHPLLSDAEVTFAGSVHHSRRGRPDDKPTETICTNEDVYVGAQGTLLWQLIFGTHRRHWPSSLRRTAMLQ